MSNELEIRAAAALEATDERTIEGWAVRWDDVADIGEYKEQFVRGSLTDSGRVKFYDQHRTLVGRVIEAEDRDEGYYIKARLSDTTAANDTYALLRDGSLDRLSIGFRPIKSEKRNGVIARLAADLLEVSAVPMPAYAGSHVLAVREEGREATNNEETEVSNMETNENEDLVELRGEVQEVRREIALLGEMGTKSEPVEMTRSIGDLVKKVAAGDETVTRAYEGAVSDDAILKDSWIGSLVKILHERQTVANTFARGGVPATGLSVEYAVLESDTTQVGVQANEGDDLLFGKVSISTETAPIKTLGGWSSLSRQAIERTNVGILDTTFTALAEKYGRAVEAQARLALQAGIAAADELQGDLTTQDGIVALLLELAEAFDDRGHHLDGLFVDRATFLSLYGVTASDRVLQVSTAPTDKVGTLNISGIEASVANVPVRVLPGAVGTQVVAYDRSAVKTLSSNMFRLQDENIVNLTKDFSVYGYGTSFVQVPDALISVVDELTGGE